MLICPRRCRGDGNRWGETMRPKTRHPATSPIPDRSVDAPRVLFVSHEASRTGAPMMFLHFLRWLRANTDLSFEILLLAGGPLADDFARIAPTHHIEALGRGSASYVEAGIVKAGFPGVADRVKVGRGRRSVDHLRGFDALYLNSTTSAIALRILPEIPPLVVSHIHELGSAFNYWFPHRDRQEMLSATDWFVACSDGVAVNLVGGYGVATDQVSRHYEFVDPPVVDPFRARTLRDELGIGPDAFIVGGAGAVIWRKGPDLFLQAAAALLRTHPRLDVHFVWVGGGGDEPIPIETDVAKLGLEGRVHFVGEIADPGDLFSNFDVFCVTSREDPYPLVMLEAASLAVPIVSFANGGATEFSKTGRGLDAAVIIPYLDADDMGETVGTLLEDPDRRHALGRRGQARVLNEHTVKVAAPRLHADLLRRLGRPADAAHRPGGDIVIDLRPTSQTSC